MRLTVLLITSLITLLSYSQIKYFEKEVTFNNPKDSIQLSGIISIPNSETPLPAVILVHPDGPTNRDFDIPGGHKIFKDMANYLSNNGIAVLRYDKRGTGKSNGNYVPYDMENLAFDGIAGIDFLKSLDEIDKKRIGAIGISQGGILTPIMATLCNDINFIIMMAGPGVKAHELFYSSYLSQIALSSAGYDSIDLKKIKDLYDNYWTIISKRDIDSSERNTGLKYLKESWEYIDMESRKDFGYIEQNAEFIFDNLYRNPNVVNFYNYIPSETISLVKCPVLAINGDKDVQVVADINLPAIERALENGRCSNYKIVKLQNHNHLFQKCETGTISEYKTSGTVSEETLSLIVDWINQLK